MRMMDTLTIPHFGFFGKRLLVDGNQPEVEGMQIIQNIKHPFPRHATIKTPSIEVSSIEGTFHGKTARYR